MILTKDKVLSDLNKLVDLKYKDFSSKLSPDTKYEILGVRVPSLRHLAKDYKKYDVAEYLKDVNFSSLEECQLYGMVLNNQKWSFEQTQKYLEKYISKIDSWAICDIFCADLKICKKEPEVLWDFIVSYIYKEREFEVRFALVSILDHFINYDNLPIIISLVEGIKIKPYYVQMGIAWLLATCFIKYPDYMLGYLKGNPKLDIFTFNKTLSKITDSLRVSKENKEIIKKMHVKNRK